MYIKKQFVGNGLVFVGHICSYCLSEILIGGEEGQLGGVLNCVLQEGSEA